MISSRRRALALTATAALLAAACGSDSDPDADSESDDAPAAADEPEPEPEPEASDEPEPEGEAADESEAEAEAEPDSEPESEPESEGSGDSGDAGDGAFPVTIEHKFGETTIDAAPERVVSIGFNEHDFLLALDVVPVGLRDWYGEQPNGVWPWAQDALGGAEPEVLSSGDLNFEQIAALDPDVIVGVWSGMTEQDYGLLSEIAPVVAQPDTYEDYGTPWQEQTVILGTALGLEEEAQAIVDEVEADIVAAREAHPEWEGLTSSVAFYFEDGPGAYTSEDTRSRFMRDLGFVIPDVNDDLGEGSFFLELSPEDITPLDVDALVWIYSSDEELEQILSLPTRRDLVAVQEGREIFAGPELTGAFSHSSPLSLEFVVDTMVAELEAATDGDPSTPTPSSVAVGAVERPAGTGGDEADAGASESGGDESAASFDGDEAVVAEAWAAVFDSSVGFDDKAGFLEDADGLAATIEAYAATGDSFGGISLVPTDVAIDGDTATVTYDVNFGENTAYGDVSGVMNFVDGVWTVSRDEFCSFMTSARVGCDS